MADEEKAKIVEKLLPQYEYILSHTCHYSFEFFIQDLFLPYFDQSKIDKNMERFLDTVIQLTKYDHYYFGHFHSDSDIKPYKATMLFHQPLELGKYYSDL